MSRVLFVSKPIAPPYHDGTKCLVRDVSSALTRYDAVVMGTDVSARANDFPRHVRVASVYRDPGKFTPALAANARAAAWLMARSRADLWHFVFAPNPRTSTVARVAKAARRAPVLQTVASPPQRFSADDFFGDVVVAQSGWTRDRVKVAFESSGRPVPQVVVVPPPIGAVPVPSADAVARIRAELDLSSDGPVFVYPGDLEVGRGAARVADAVPAIAERVPGAVVVFACRHKTKAAPAVEDELRRRLDPRSVRFVREVNLHALLVASRAVLFPVDDLRGKVDLPISLLEAMRLRVPVVTGREGPLADLEGVLRVGEEDPVELARAAAALAAPETSGDVRSRLISDAENAVANRYDSRVVTREYERLYDSLLTKSEAPR